MKTRSQSSPGGRREKLDQLRQVACERQRGIKRREVRQAAAEHERGIKRQEIQPGNVSASWSSSHHPSQTTMSSNSASDASGAAHLVWKYQETEFLLQKMGETVEIRADFHRSFATTANAHFGVDYFTNDKVRSKINSLAQVWANNRQDGASSSSAGATGGPTIRLLRQYPNLDPYFNQISETSSSVRMGTKRKQGFTSDDLLDFMVRHSPEDKLYYYALAFEQDKTFEAAALRCFQSLKRRKQRESIIFKTMQDIFQQRSVVPQ